MTLPKIAAIVVAVAALLLYMHLLSDREILALEMDAANEVQMALDYLSGTYSPTKPPGTSLLMLGSASLGIPFRIFVALLAVGVVFHSLYLMVRSELDFAWAISFSAVAAVFIGLAPPLVTEGDVTGNYLVIGLFHLYLAALITYGLFAKSTTALLSSSLGLFVISGFGAITRVDSLIVKAPLLILAAIVLFHPALRQRFLRRVLVAVGAVFAGIWVFEYGATSFNEATYNVRGVANYVDARYSDFFNVVAALPSDQPTHRHFLADARRRELAYELSATAMSMRDIVESRAGWCGIDFEFGRQHYGIDDVPNTLFFWHIDRCMRGAGVGPGDYLEKLGTAAREIKTQAAWRGLKTRYLIAQALSPQLGIWYAHVFPSLKKVYRLSFPAMSYDYVLPETKSRDLAASYDRATLRRTALVTDPRVVNPSLAHLQLIYAVYARLAAVAVPLCVLAVVLALMRRSCLSVSGVGVLILSTFVACRLAFYALFDAAFYPVPKAYLLANFVLAFAILCVGVLYVCRTLAGYPARHRVAPAGVKTPSVHVGNQEHGRQ